MTVVESDELGSVSTLLASARVLVVDDSRLMRLGLIRSLRELGVQTVSEAANGQEALDRIRLEPFDLMLLDIEMPIMSGTELLVAMKSQSTLQRLPVIVISSSEQIDTAVKCIELGAEDYLPKTYNPTLLRARVTSSIDKKRLRDLDALRVRQLQEEKEILERTQKRLDHELAEAFHYVQSSFPEPLSSPIKVDWFYQPSTELGGDAFGYHWIDNEYFAVYLLDVCGHGVGACLLAVTAINVMRTQALIGVDFRDPAAVLAGISNAFLCEKHNDMYFTLWYGVYQKSTRQLSHASGGHPPALLLGPVGEDGRSPSTPLRAPGLIVGVMEDIPYTAQTVQVSEGSTLLVLCDGCFEIRATDGTEGTFEDFEQFMQVAGKRPTGLSDLFESARVRHGEGPLDDDFSIVRVSF
jgi:sigma-B regulation protein RsbU (phosphoserine phosphatase)